MTRIFCALVLISAAATGCRTPSSPPPPPESAKVAPVAAVEQAQAVETPPPFDRSLLAIFQSAPVAKREDPPELVELGRMLYFDTRLSKNHDLSCNSCHDVAAYGVDGKQFSPGHRGQLGGRNSPTVYDAEHHVAQFWDGRAKDLEEQAQGPVMNPVEMAMPDEKRVVATLRSIPEYAQRFAKLFPAQGKADPVSLANAARAIAAFERTLVTTSRFDRFVAGDDSALTEAERRGLQTFAETGCTACHSGRILGGQTFMKLGLVKEWPQSGKPDLGRYDVTKEEHDRGVFRVAPLRNVAKTGPWFHDGAETDLRNAVKKMAEHQLGRVLGDAEAGDIVAFLESLTGELPPADVNAAPQLPPSTKTTPKPDPT